MLPQGRLLLFLLSLALLAFWPKLVLAMASCEPFGCLTPIEEECASNLHPVILIHGLGGKPEDWRTADQNYVQLLLDAGYPEDYIEEYFYADADGNDQTYDYQGDIRLISADLPEYVERLSSLSKQCGGDESVDLVGYSLGGLVAREYLHQSSLNFKDHKIRKLVTVGTPHQGVYLLWLDKIVDVFPDAPLLIRTQLHQMVNRIIWKSSGSENRQSPDLNSDAVQEIRPDSEFLAELNNLTMIVKHPSYYTFYGSIDATIGFQIFVYKLFYEINLGDLLVLPKSAVGISGPSTSRYPLSDKEDITLGVLGDAQSGFGFSLDLLTMKDENYKHTKLLKLIGVQSTIVSILTTYK